MLSDFIAYKLAKNIYQTCRQVRVARNMRDQLDRASASIALNIAEGSGKRSPGDQARFYSIALGSLRECHAILDLENKCAPDLAEQINQLGAILYTLSKKPNQQTP